jgi:hypothetical protein
MKLTRLLTQSDFFTYKHGDEVLIYETCVNGLDITVTIIIRILAYYLDDMNE